MREVICKIVLLTVTLCGVQVPPKPVPRPTLVYGDHLLDGTMYGEGSKFRFLKDGKVVLTVVYKKGAYSVER